jgi:hypothetical protein
MPNSADVNFREIDKSFSVPSLITGVEAVLAQTLRGPYGHDGNIYSNWAEFSKKYGSEVSGMEGPTQIKRALDRGAALRVVKIGHYTTIGDPGSLDAVKGTFGAGLGEEAGDAYFQLALKYPGEDYNNLTAVISAASNGDATYFDLSIIHGEDSRLTENFTNLIIIGTPNVVDSTYLEDVISGSQLVDVTYLDTSAFGGPLRPDDGTFAVTGGSDGGLGAVAQVDTVSLTGTDGTAQISAIGGLVKVATFNTTLTLTASDFVTANAAAYLAVGIVLTSSVADLIFTSNVAGVSQTVPTISNLTLTLAGTVVATTPNTKGGPVDADYSGDAAGTGFYHLAGYNDFDAFASVDNFTAAVHIAGASYAEIRQDCYYIAHLANSNNTLALLTAARATITTDTKYLYIVGGGLGISSPFVTNDTLEIPEVGDVIGTAARSDAEYGRWYSFAGPRRGLVLNALNIVNNFGENQVTLDALANRQINMVVSRDGRMRISGNFSGQLATSRKSFMSVVKLLIHIKKSLRPSLENYLEEPNDFSTFKDIANEIIPFLEDLKSRDKRALVDYAWRGDQNANQDSELSINNRTDLDAGKYKVELYLKEVVSLQELTVDIISSPSGVSFEDQF